MNKEMIISSGDHETRVAILEDDQVVEVFIERERQRGVVGNIYKGRVSKVLPGMQSSFVDIGLERDAFREVGIGVTLHGRADVAALDVEDRQNAQVTGATQHMLERRDAPRAMPLEEGRVRLHGRARADRGLEHRRTRKAATRDGLHVHPRS